MGIYTYWQGRDCLYLYYIRHHMKKILIILFLLPAFANGQIISTIAGNGTGGYSGDGGAANAAMLNNPIGVYEDLHGNIYIADEGNNRIRKVNSTTGIISTVAGNGVSGYTGDYGMATAATLNAPYGVAVDGIGNIYIADHGNNVIRKVNTSGIITTVVGTGVTGFSGDGGPATSAQITTPSAVTVDAYGNIYIADYGNSCVRKVDIGTGIISTIAGGGSTVTGGVFPSGVLLRLLNYLTYMVYL